DICRLGVINGVDGGDWCRDIMVRKLGNGNNIRFWKDTWLDAEPLCHAFPRLFSMSIQPDCTVNQMGRWVNDVWYWEFSWRRNPFVWEEELIGQLLRNVSRAEVVLREDSWISLIGDAGVYSVKAGYQYLSDNFLPDTNLNESVCNIMKNLWYSLAPQKVVIFSWQLLYQRLPTKANLLHRRVVALESDLARNPSVVGITNGDAGIAHYIF
ncbi:putative non-LTR retroelement reverse transcriptase related, partial [Trifolium medium]|nr:putative non-LTR retroelement reverse transcriptase related [Trifolium medium]